MTRVLFAIADTGAGHRRIAMALDERLRARCDATSVIIDLHAEVATPLFKNLGRTYQQVSTSPIVLRAYNAAFAITNSRRVSAALALLLRRTRMRAVVDLLATHDPDLVVVVHPLFATEMIAAAREHLAKKFPIAVVVSDPVNPHASWASSAADFIFATSEEAAGRLRRFGRSDATVVDFPVGCAFTTPWQAPQAARRGLDLAEDAFTVLLMGGGCGAGRMAEDARAIARHSHDLQLVVLCGHNDALYEELVASRRMPNQCRVERFVNRPCDYIDAADVVASKAGPSTIFEAAHRKRQLFITDEGGSQERGNGRMAEEHGWATRIWRPVDLAHAVAAAPPANSTRTLGRDPGDGGEALADKLAALLA